MSDCVGDVGATYQVGEVGSIVPEGYKQTEVGVIPEDWEVVQLKKLLRGFRNGFAFSAGGYKNTGIPIITMAQIGLSGEFQFETSQVRKWSSTELDRLKEYWVQDGDLLIAMTDVTPEKNLIGQMAIANLKDIALLNQRVGLLRLNNCIGDKVFYSYM